MIDPRSVQYYRIGPGTGTIGSLTDPATIGRLSLPQGFALAHIYVYFYGGTGTATLTMYQQTWSHKPSTNRVRWTWTGKGGGAAATEDTYAELGVNDYEVHQFIWRPGDDLVLTWTDPSSGATTWTIDIGYLPL